MIFSSALFLFLCCSLGPCVATDGSPDLLDQNSLRAFKLLDRHLRTDKMGDRCPFPPGKDCSWMVVKLKHHISNLKRIYPNEPTLLCKLEQIPDFFKLTELEACLVNFITNGKYPEFCYDVMNKNGDCLLDDMVMIKEMCISTHGQKFYDRLKQQQELLEKQRAQEMSGRNNNQD